MKIMPHDSIVNSGALHDYTTLTMLYINVAHSGAVANS